MTQPDKGRSVASLRLWEVAGMTKSGLEQGWREQTCIVAANDFGAAAGLAFAALMACSSQSKDARVRAVGPHMNAAGEQQLTARLSQEKQ